MINNFVFATKAFLYCLLLLFLLFLWEQFSLVAFSIFAIIFMCIFFANVLVTKTILSRAYHHSGKYSLLYDISLHYFLPGIYLGNSILFLQTNINPYVWGIFFLINFFILFVFFKNIFDFYKKEFKHELHSHYIYDIIKLIIIFFGTLNILSLQVGDLSKLVFVSLLIVTMGLLALVQRRKLDMKHSLYTAVSVLTGVFLAVATILLLQLPHYKEAFIVTNYFTIILSVTHHITQEDLSLGLIWEYLIYALVSIGVVFVI